MGKVYKMPCRELDSLYPYVSRNFLQLQANCAKIGIRIIPVQTLRTGAYQHSLYELGRTKPGKKVTEADSGHSYHEVAVAIDFCILDEHGRADWGIPHYKTVGQMAKKLKFEWGGDFKTRLGVPMHDDGHIQMSGGLTVAEWIAFRTNPKKAKKKPNFPTV